ncbi:MFS transporter [Aquabacter cavernae]|uniref:MFS transporter n=1 Tax=Aquabacter cavernae TaxID=2496029 RepID=UPI000F8F6539|nr:MFS transporter [Aquabacter cavernae]
MDAVSGQPAAAGIPSLASEPAAPQGAALIGARMDALPVTPLHGAIFALCTIGLSADIAEVALSNVLVAVFLAPPYNLARSDLSLLLASVFAGGALGAPLFGWLADHHGRRLALQIALVIIAVSSIAAAASQDVTSMTIARFVSGLAIGGYPPLTATYMSDILPPARRGALMLACAGLAFLGAPAAILAMKALSPMTFGLEGWRWVLAGGGLVATIPAVLLGRMPESPRWLAARGRDEEALLALKRFEAAASGRAKPSAPTLAASEETGETHAPEPGRNRRRFMFLASLYGLGPWATLGFPLLSAAVMVHKGFSISDSILFSGLSMLGPAVGILAAAPAIDLLDRRAALVVTASVMVCAGIAFAATTALIPLVLLGLIFNLASAVYNVILGLYAAEMFPTSRRASATAGAWAVGRLVSICVPLVLLPLLTASGPAAMFAVITGALVLSLGLIIVLGPTGRARRALA